jgi:signal transduction histidine kinase
MIQMAMRSLHARLLTAAAVAIAFALFLAGWTLVKIFERHTDLRLETELDNHLRQIAASLELDQNGAIFVNGALPDSRFELPFSGLYWQVEQQGQVIAASASLGDEKLNARVPFLPSERPICVDVPGPRGRPVILVARDINMSIEGKDHNLRLAAAVDQAELNKAVRAFRNDLALSLGVLGLALTLAAWAQVHVGLAPLTSLRMRLGDVRRGFSQRVNGQFPKEVTPLVQDLNGLLESQEKSLTRARSRAGELAHGLKTPLTALNSIARDLATKGDKTLASEVQALVQRMQGHVERELARARVAGRRLHRDAVPLLGTIEGLQRALMRMPRGNSVVWTVRVDPSVTIAMDRNDLDELLGNVLDNAQRWARSEIRITADGPACSTLLIEDDGPGLSEEELTTVRERGVSHAPERGHAGLGLAIVSDVADAYGYGLSLERSDLGGLLVRLTVPHTATIT